MKIIMANPIYNIGDKVKIVKYGHLIFEINKSEHKLSFPLVEETKEYRCLDISPEVVGQIGIIADVSDTQGLPTYAISGINNKYAWFNEEQIEKV